MYLFIFIICKKYIVLKYIFKLTQHYALQVVVAVT